MGVSSFTKPRFGGAFFQEIARPAYFRRSKAGRFSRCALACSSWKDARVVCNDEPDAVVAMGCSFTPVLELASNVKAIKSVVSWACWRESSSDWRWRGHA